MPPAHARLARITVFGYCRLASRFQAPRSSGGRTPAGNAWSLDKDGRVLTVRRPSVRPLGVRLHARVYATRSAFLQGLHYHGGLYEAEA